ncbi:MAG: alpha-mannosidase [Actinobacteria bacterium]|nr:alpha-mannosidase [Actinomycetota bacterium]
MHDDRLLVEARLRRVVDERIRPAVRPARRRLAVEAWEAPGDPVPVGRALAAPYSPVSVGDPFGRPWGTTWFRMTDEVPKEWSRQRVEAVVDLSFSDLPGFQAEATLWGPLDGSAEIGPMRGIHPLNHDIAVADPAAGGERVELLIEAASNPNLTAHRPSPLSDITTSGNTPIYRLTAADLVVVDVTVYELLHDVRAVTRLMRQLPLDGSRRHELLRALERMLDALTLDDVATTAAAARAELAGVMGRPASASAHRLSAIGHAHIDSAWLWPIRETKRKCVRSFANVLDLMDRYPELRFACSSAAQHDWIREEQPALFERIRKRAAEGRWVPVGGMWVEPDVNLPSGESLIRQITYGQRFFAEYFGAPCTEIWIPDVFGYSGALPQIACHGGLGRFLTQKMSWNKVNRFPHSTFWWEGIDGSAVFTHFPPVETYGAILHPAQHAHAEATFAEKGRATRSLLPFGFGDGGGGPTRDMLEQYRRLRDIEGGPRIEIESPREFFDAAIAEYPDAPRWVGELYFETHRGTYTSQARTKQGNRRCELLLREAELWSALAFGGTAAGGYPKQALDRIWKTVLLHQFHDILPGSSIAWVHREAEATYARLRDELGGLIETALATIAGQPTAVVANAAPHDRDEVVAVPAVVATDLPADATQPLADGRVAVRLAVPAMTVRPIAGAVVHPAGGSPARPVNVTEAAAGETAGERAGIVVDNGVLRVEIDRADGLCTSILSAGREVLVAGSRGNLLQLHPDLPAEYDAWDLDPWYRRQVTDLDGVDALDVLDAGPLVARVRVRRTFRSSSVTQTYELRAASPRLDIRTELDWHERDHVLKAAFPLDVHTDHLTREIQFGHVSSAIHTNTSWDAARFEVCAHRWVDASEPGFGVALLNDGRYGHDATRTRTPDDRPATTVRLTLLRGAQYPDPHADEGRHLVTYALMPHAGDLGHGGVVEEAYRLNLPMRVAGAAEAAARSDTATPGTLATPAIPPTGPTPAPPATPATPATPASRDRWLVRSEHPGVVVEAVKAADDGSGDVIVRCYEAWGARSPLRLRLASAPATVSVVDLLEEPSGHVPTVPLGVDGAEVRGELRPFQLVTLRLTAR